MSKQVVKSTAQLTDDGRDLIIMKLIHYLSKRENEDQKKLYRHIYTMKRDQISQWINLIGGSELVNKSGKIAKRIRRNCAKELGAKLPPTLLSEFGNIASNNSSTAGSFYIEIDDDLMSMDHGQFDDDGSCFYLEYGHDNNYHHRLAMDANTEFTLIKVYDSNNAPIARAFSYSPNSSSTIIFNAYGLTRIKIASLLAQVLNNASMREVRLTSDVWINGNMGTALGNTDEDSYHVDCNVSDYRHECNDEEQYDCYCEYCETGISFDFDDYQGTDWGIYCDSCYYDLFTFCQQCEEDYLTADTYFHEVVGDSQIDLVCETCANDDFILCEHCDTYHTEDLIHEVENEIYLCDDCHADHAYDCLLCDQEFYTDQDYNQDHDQDQICEDCISDINRNFATITAQCKQCEDHFLRQCADHYSAKLLALNTGAMLSQFALAI